jgi:PadR family transcriptional regulator, regulatory protein PadR
VVIDSLGTTILDRCADGRKLQYLRRAKDARLAPQARPLKKGKKRLTHYTVYRIVCGVHYMTPGTSNHEMFENLRLELRRGSLVLAVLAVLRKEHYGYTLRKTLGEQGMAIDEGTLYPLLRRLESQGLLVSEWREEEKRNKRFYRLSADGKVILKQLLAEWQSINSSLNAML